MSKLHSGYASHPAIYADTIVFCCEDDLWMLELGDPRAWRLTHDETPVLYPKFSNDGTRLAFLSQQEGRPEVYVMASGGGVAKRLTLETADKVMGWAPEGLVLYNSSANRPFADDSWLHGISPQGGLPHRFPWGPVSSVAWSPEGIILGRNTRDPVGWKRYRGGQSGEFWFAAEQDNVFSKIPTPAGNVSDPCWLGSRLFFLSDHEGIGNVYSMLVDGSDLQRHSNHSCFYARNLSSDGRRLIYHSAGELYLLEPDGAESKVIDVHLTGCRSKSRRRFFTGNEFFQRAHINPEGTHLAVISRGQAFALPNWEGPVVQLGEALGVRYRSLCWVHPGERLLAVAADDSAEEYLVEFAPDGATLRRLDLEVGRPELLEPSPCDGRVAMTNHRNELLLVDLDENPAVVTTLDHSEHGRVRQVSWSSDGRWLAYDHATTSRTRAIRVCELESLTVTQVAEPVLEDSYPAFDPAGRYLYFIGQREFQPLRDDVGFGLGLPQTSRIYAIGLRSDVPSPFVRQPKPLESEALTIRRKAEAELARRSVTTEIDFEGLQHRIWPFPMSPERYGGLRAVDGKLFFLEGESLSPDPEGGRVSRWTLEYFDLETQEQVRLVNKWVGAFTITPDGRTVLMCRNNTLRVLNAREKYRGPDSSSAGPKTGWVELKRIKVFSHPAPEFRQMFREAWRLQRDHFWKGDMNGLDWDAIYDRYRPLVEKINTRSEFSDLLQELLGELGTSHAYDFYRAWPKEMIWQGFLGVDFESDPEEPMIYRCGHIVEGAPWKVNESSPLLHCARVGDRVLAINGLAVGGATTPAQRLLNQGGEKIQVTLQSPGGEPRQEVVRALYSDRKARYRDWVRKNREEVCRRTKGRVGYLHVPDMSCEGFAEFQRGFLAQCDKEALIVDVRFNGGGQVSELLLERLARKRIGCVFPRWEAPRPYPLDSPRGPLVAMTNEQAGSDGDIFSHGFKLRKLGPLVGKRTWGGTVGIAPRYSLVDGTVTSQPEFSFFFDDVGSHLENRGTDPDVEVDNTPGDYLQGRDSQLLRAIEIALDQLKEAPEGAASSGFGA